MIIAANLKCNHSRASFKQYVQIVNSGLKELNSRGVINLNIPANSGENLDVNSRFDDEIIVLPPCSAFISGDFEFTLGAQNFYPAKSGSFTGEIGGEILDEFAIKCVLIGHSERRALGESEELLREKFNYAKERGFRTIYCVGESDITRMNGSTLEFLGEQIENIDANYENLVIAYEPIWAIGTGKSANLEQIAEILGFLRERTKAPLLYGGSVNSQNIAQIASLPDCGGVLVGTASWEARGFLDLIERGKNKC